MAVVSAHSQGNPDGVPLFHLPIPTPYEAKISQKISKTRSYSIDQYNISIKNEILKY